MTIERRSDGWYRDGRRIVFERRPLFWTGCDSHPVLKLARRVLEHSSRLGWALVVYGATVTEERSLGLGDDQRPAQANPHPAAVEGRKSQWYRVEFTTGDNAVIQITDQGSWGPEDADVDTTVAVVSGTVPRPSEAAIDVHRVAPIVVSEAEARRAVPKVANSYPGLNIPGYDTLVHWVNGRVICDTTSATVTPEAVVLLNRLFAETMQRARTLIAPYQHVEGGWWKLPRDLRAMLLASGIPDAFFVQCFSRY